MKKISFFLLLLCIQFSVKADEGMWMPLLISQNYEAMQKMGLKLTPEQIYDINKSSLKDAIVHFGGGCTGEIISDQGLLLTNHHCGYDAIATLSSVSNNHLMNGFMAGSQQQELPAPGLSVKFLIRIEDVTERVNNFIGDAYGVDVEKQFSKISKEIATAANEGGVYESDVKSFFAGNKYYLFVYQRFTDVRLVAAPPENLGKFGGDTDNWMWPRHTCDFSMFRVYSNNDNKPAAYSPNNRPYRPKHHLPVSLKGVRDNDYAMIMGYPGRTTRYLTSYGVDLAINISNPTVVKIRDKRLAIMREEMEKDPAVDLQYASNYAQIANYWKYFIGQTEQLKNLNILAQKQQEEAEFQRWVSRNNDGLSRLMSDFQKAYAAYQPYVKHQTFYREAFLATGLGKLGASFETLEKAYNARVSRDSIEVLCKRLLADRKGVVKNMNIELDKKLFAALNLMFYQDVPKSQHPAVFSNIVFRNFGSENWQRTFELYADDVYSRTSLLDSNRFKSLCKADQVDKLLQDPAVAYALSVVNNYKTYYEPKVSEFNYEMFELNRAYQGGLLEKNKNKLMSPDANSTMRVSYGKVSSYAPKDAVFYNYYTMADGLLQKYKAGDKEFDLQPKIVDLLKSKNYGSYQDKELGGLVTCFITTNDITGGNSGSPVMNGSGELIGCAFDGNWEAMSGDIAFDKRYKRTICADIRYIMWVVDKVLDGHHLMDEMSIRN
ncbi:MAG: S46 family peptidase [Chitinophagaceae bacterium]|nr:S46 family peptidase [Chitinophagaceae bacterium]